MAWKYDGVAAGTKVYFEYIFEQLDSIITQFAIVKSNSNILVAFFLYLCEYCYHVNINLMRGDEPKALYKGSNFWQRTTTYISNIKVFLCGLSKAILALLF